MTSDTSTLQDADWLHPQRHSDREPQPALVVVWSLEEPHRLGEVMLPGAQELVLGRDPGSAPLFQQRPGRSLSTGPLRARTISRRQLAVRREQGGVWVRNLGRGELRISGVPVAEGTVPLGGLIEVASKLLLMVTSRPPTLPPLRNTQVRSPFGRPDEHGIVGESPAAWALRDALALVGRLPGHTLLQGPSGTGKELAARALHALSPRHGGPLVSRSAATLPEGLVDAELFGNAENYPNPGMRQRPGLIGAADRGTLFLDEIGELPHAQQASLLRVMDGDGEYQRLGEARVRHSDFRLVAATNRDLDALKHDLGARLPLRVSLPPLQQRRADIPLLVQHLLSRSLRDDGLRRRFADSQGRPRIAPALLSALLLHDYSHHVRELDAMLWAALSTSPEHYLDLTDAVRQHVHTPAAALRWQAWIGRPPADIPPDALQACLDDHNGSQEATWQALGMSSRYQLSRLVKKHGLVIRKAR